MPMTPPVLLCRCSATAFSGVPNQLDKWLFLIRKEDVEAGVALRVVFVISGNTTHGCGHLRFDDSAADVHVRVGGIYELEVPPNQNFQWKPPNETLGMLSLNFLTMDATHRRICGTYRIEGPIAP